MAGDPSPTYQPLADDYQRLAAYPAALPPAGTRLALSLPQIEALVGAALPLGSRAPTWWANTPRLAPARAWLAAGWSVTGRSLRATPQLITFTRGVDAASRPTARSR